MSRSSVNRRDILKAGSSLTAIAVAGCSESDLEDDSNSSDTGKTPSSTPIETEEKPEYPSKPEPVAPDEYTLPAEYTVEEWRGTLELGEDQIYGMQKITPNDRDNENVAGYHECLILECEIEVDRLDERVDLFLVPDGDKDNFTETAKLEHCSYRIPEIGGYGPFLETCNQNMEQYSEESLPGNKVEVKPEETVFARFLIPDTEYHLVMDPTRAIGDGLFDIDSGREAVDMDLDPKIRLLEDNADLARQEVRASFDDWFEDLNEASPEHTISEVQAFAREVCRSDLAGQLASESVDNFADDIDKVKQYSGFADSTLTDINEYFEVNVPVDFTDRLDTMASWGSTALPVIATLITIAEKSCDLAEVDPNVSDEVLGEKVENLLMSIAGLVIQVVFLKLGVAKSVSKNVIKSAETFVMGYVRKLAGLRVFAYVVNSLAVRLEEGVVGVIRDFVQRIIEEISEHVDEEYFFDSDEQDLLDKVKENDGWDDLEFLEEDGRACSDLNRGEAFTAHLRIDESFS